MFSIDLNHIDICESNLFSILVTFIISAKSRSWHKQVLKCLSRLPNYLFAPHCSSSFITIPSSKREGLRRKAIFHNNHSSLRSIGEKVNCFVGYTLHDFITHNEVISPDVL